MSILIRGMEMPNRCAECRLSTAYSFNDRPLCDVLVEYMSYGDWEAKRLDNCPLVPVPPHDGPLVSALEVIRSFPEEFVFTNEQARALTHYIIPADSGEESEA